MTTTLTGSLVERADAEAFFDAWRERYAAAPPHHDGVVLHDQLLDAAFDTAGSLVPRRRLAMSNAGVPVVYSHKTTRRAGAPRFRLLAEPGGTGITVAEQILLSRDLLARMSRDLGWQRACDQVNAVLDQLIPADADAVADWHGGLGFGLEIGERGPELRLYCNVRHGDLTSRWQRFADAVGVLADARVDPAFRDLLARATPRTVPAGLALAIGGGELRALRLYCGLVDATSESAIAAAPPGLLGAAPTIRQYIDSYRHTFGPLEEQGITVAYDFAVRNGSIQPSVARYKVDILCEHESDRDRARLVAWIDERMETMRMDGSAQREFLADLEEGFGGWAIQYMSLGCSGVGDELTAYCIPGRRAVEGPSHTASPRAAPTRESVVAIGTVIDGGIAHLLSRRDASGWWSDFRTLAGPSTEWVAAFVAFALARTNRPAAVAAARDMWSRLRRRRWWSAGWGYTGGVPSDADSTIWALHLAAAVGAPSNRRALRFLARHVTDEGALATYARAGPIRAFTRFHGISFAGWCGPHACVSAAGLGLEDLPHRERVLAWLRGAQRAEGSWSSYWWKTPHYATALAAEALADACGPGDRERVSRAVDWAVSDILERRGDGATPFELAFALRTSLLDARHGDASRQLVARLGRAQSPNGGWQPSAMLRIPPPDMIDPDGCAAWIKAGQGGRSIQVDQGRFTTAAVLLALRRAEERGLA